MSGREPAPVELPKTLWLWCIGPVLSGVISLVIASVQGSSPSASQSIGWLIVLLIPQPAVIGLSERVLMLTTTAGRPLGPLAGFVTVILVAGALVVASILDWPSAELSIRLGLAVFASLFSLVLATALRAARGRPHDTADR